MVPVIALKRIYRVAPGEVFPAQDEAQARALVAIGLAKWPEDPPVEPRPVRRRYQRRDLRAEPA